MAFNNKLWVIGGRTGSTYTNDVWYSPDGTNWTLLGSTLVAIAVVNARISGIEAVQDYLVREVQSVYRSQRVDIDDKHIEIIIAQMLRKVAVKTMGDTGLLPGSVIDKFAFRPRMAN